MNRCGVLSKMGVGARPPPLGCAVVSRARLGTRALLQGQGQRQGQGQAMKGLATARCNRSRRGISGSQDRRRDITCAAGLVKKVTTQELEVAISSRDKPMVIDFFATWCGPCVMLSKVLEELAAELGDSVEFVKVDTDEEVELSTYFQIQGLPTLMFLGKDKGGKVLRAEGLLPAGQIRQMIEDVS